MSEDDDYEALSPNAGLGVRQTYVLSFTGFMVPSFLNFFFRLFIGQHVRRRSRKCRQLVIRHGLDGSRLDNFLLGRYYGALGDVPG